MRRRWIPLLALGLLCVLAASAQGVEINGSFGIDADVLPAFSLDARFDVGVSGDTWSISSGTDVDLLPTLGAAERISLAYDLDPIRLAASLSMAFAPYSATSRFSAEVDLFSLALREEAPVMDLSSDLTIGAVIDAAVVPYVRLYTRLGLADHWLANTTTIDIIPFGVESSLLGYVSFGQISVSDGAVVVTPYAYISLDLVPSDFGYVQANADITLDGVSIRSSVTYSGNTSIVVSSMLTVDLDPITFSVWGSFTSAASSPLAVGLSADVAWGPL